MGICSYLGPRAIGRVRPRMQGGAGARGRLGSRGQFSPERAGSVRCLVVQRDSHLTLHTTSGPDVPLSHPGISLSTRLGAGTSCFCMCCLFFRSAALLRPILCSPSAEHLSPRPASLVWVPDRVDVHTVGVLVVSSLPPPRGQLSGSSREVLSAPLLYAVIKMVSGGAGGLGSNSELRAARLR